MASRRVEFIHVSDIDWHRNGISGEGFHVVQFIYEGHALVATVFPKDHFVAVVEPANMEQHYRGDCFERALRVACTAYDIDRTRRISVRMLA